MTSVYDQHSKSFSNVSACAILHDGRAVGSIAFKFPKDGAGRLYAYVHILGVGMVRGSASGYGYDKASAALANAAKQFPADIAEEWQRVHGGLDMPQRVRAFIAAIAKDNGTTWSNALRAAGFEVFATV